MPNSNLSTVSELSLKEKIGQLFLMGFRGNDISEDSEVLNMIKEHKPGGVILFDKDMVHDQPVHNIKSPEQVRSLTKALQESSETPLLIGIDQEGGLINRLKPEYGFPETISHQKLGEKDDTVFTESHSRHIAKTLSEAGINLNFAPVLDLSSNPDSSIIAKRERSFGSSPEKVTRHARAYIKGHQQENIQTCCKHFPGHGSAEGDTHAGFVDITDTWEEHELAPYETLINEGLCTMIMTAHIFHSEMDEVVPATLSRNVLKNLLRKNLGFSGVIISDDMQMRAISDHYSLKESLEEGLKAGLDIFCFGNNLLKEQVELKDCVSAVEQLVEEGEITEQRIDESVSRILKLKESL
ncbi:glycoside hydrolase family 3 protein [Gracilimonas sp.]|uniref:glycoside hydrolase family 3 protein n=1 Tax=Gracilimonas sp. TaxID=1974203 RepID=UPI003D0FA9AD